MGCVCVCVSVCECVCEVAVDFNRKLAVRVTTVKLFRNASDLLSAPSVENLFGSKAKLQGV